MDWPTIVGSIVGSLVIAGLGYAGVRATVRGSLQASADATRVEERRADIDGWKSLLDATRGRVDDLEQSVDDLRQQLTAERSWRAEAVRYMRALMRLLHEHAPDVDVPDPPVELDLTLTYQPKPSRD